MRVSQLFEEADDAVALGFKMFQKYFSSNAKITKIDHRTHILKQHGQSLYLNAIFTFTPQDTKARKQQTKLIIRINFSKKWMLTVYPADLSLEELMPKELIDMVNAGVFSVDKPSDVIKTVNRILELCD